MATGWIVRRPDDDETKKKAAQLPTVKQNYSKQFLQATKPAGTTAKLPTNNVEKAKELIKKQQPLAANNQVGSLPRLTTQQVTKPAASLPNISQGTQEKAKEIGQRAQGLTPNQIRQQNLENIQAARERMKQQNDELAARTTYALQDFFEKPKQQTQQEAQTEKQGWFGPNVWAGWTRWNQNLASSADKILPDELTIKPVQQALDYYQRVGQEAAERAAAINEEQKVPEFLSTITQGTVTAIPDVLLAWMTGGTSLAGTSAMTLSKAAANPTVGNAIVKVAKGLANNPNFYRSFLQTFGPSIDTAKENGASDLEAVAFGMLYTLPAAGMEVSGGFETMAQNPKGVLNWLKGLNDEGKEEVLQGAAEWLAAKATYAPETKWFSLTDQNAVINPGRALQEYGAGATIAGILGAPVNIAGLAAEARADRKAGTVELTAESGENARAGQLAGALTEGAEPGFVTSAREKTQQQLEAEKAKMPAAQVQQAIEEYQKTEHHGNILDGIRSGLPEIETMEPVAQLTGQEFQKSETDNRSLKEKVIEFFNSIGNKVSREGFGDIALNNAGVRDSLNHGYGKLKAATFAAVPNVLKSGKIIGYDPNYQNRGYESFLFAAPVKVGQETTYVGALVIKDKNTQRYKLHEVLTMEKDGVSSFQNGGPQTSGRNIRDDKPSSDQTIAQTPAEVNAEEAFEDFWFGHPDLDEQEARELYNEVKAGEGGKRQSWLTYDLADRLQRELGTDVEAESLREELDGLFREVDREGWTTKNRERLEKIAKKLVDNEKGTVNRDRTQQIKDAKAYLRKITLPVTSDMKAELESRFGNWKDFVKKHRNKLRFELVEGPTAQQSIDAFYAELHDIAPEWFPAGLENATDYDIMAHVVNFVDNATEVRDYALNQDYAGAVGEVAGRIRSGYYTLHQGLRQSAAIDAEYSPDMEERHASAEGAPEEAAAMLRDDSKDGGMLVTAESNLEDVAATIDGGGSYLNLDISRVLDKVAGNNKVLRQRLYLAIERPLIRAKNSYAKNVISRMNSYKAEMDRMGIKAGSKESAAVQWLGEGKRQTGKNGETQRYSLEQLKAEFPDSWQNIVEAEKIHRRIYDEYVQRINAALAKVFPDVEARAEAELNDLKEKADVALARAQEQNDLVKGLVARAEAMKAQTRGTDLAATSKAKQELTRLTRQISQENARAKSRNDAAKKAVQAFNDLSVKIEDGSYFVGKRLMPRKDYFHHFVEMEQSGSLQALRNILNRPSDIAAELVGVSDYTKPKSKWWGALQRRTGAAYTEDAVGGMARYIPAAEYKISIDPYIAQMRGTVKSLVDGSAATRNANGFIEFLTDWTNDLAGKSNPIDRGAQKLTGRKIMKVLEWVNNRVKANAVVGNIGSAIVQIGNIPNATTYIQNPTYWTKAAATLANAEKAQTLLAQSPFLTERYMGKITGMFDQKNALQRGAEWVLEIGDQKASELIWLAAYNQYEAEGGKVKGPREYESAVDYADDVTRRSVAGRGVGELPLTQRSRLVKLFAPFQVEVNNTWNLMKEQVGVKNAKGLVTYCAAAWITNGIIEAVANKRPLFDPVQALIEAIKAAVGDEEEEGSLGAAGQRLLGEAASNVPYLSTVAPLFFDTDDMEKVFGEQDPTRYGTGISATADLFTQAGNAMNGKPVDWLGLTTTYVTPYGGQQLERFVEASQDAGLLPRRMIVDEEGTTKLQRAQSPANYNDAGQLRFGLNGAGDIALDYLFGPYATSGGREYLESGSKPLSEKKTLTANEAQKKGIPLQAYQEYLKTVDRDKNGTVTQKEAEKTLNSLGLTKEQKRYLFAQQNSGWKNNPYK